MRGFLTTAGIVARQELADSIRSRRALVLLLLYFAMAAALTLLFIKALHQVENQMESAVGISQSQHAGASTSALWKSHGFRQILIRLSGDEALARDLLTLPPLALFFGWMSFFFTPLLVILLSASRVAEEVWSGSARFALFRVARAPWVFGKLAGQATQLGAALAVSAATTYVIGWWRLAGFDGVDNAAAMAMFVGKAWVYSFAWLGIAMLVSQLVTNPILASALGVIGLMAVCVASSVSALFAGDGWRMLFQVVRLLTPGGYEADLWRLDPTHTGPATAALLALGLAYTAAGYGRFARRDL